MNVSPRHFSSIFSPVIGHSSLFLPLSFFLRDFILYRGCMCARSEFSLSLSRDSVSLPGGNRTVLAIIIIIVIVIVIHGGG